MPQRRLILNTLLIYLGVSFSVAGQERCGTVMYNNTLKKQYPLRETTEQLEQWLKQKQFQQKVAPLSTQRTEALTYTVPVVVHVLYFSDIQNIPDAQIKSQLDVLNKDFQRINTDAANTPPAFAPVAGSLNINFILAKQDPDGLPTTGINRIKVNQSAFGGVNSNLIDDSKIKAYSYWPAEDYLNIWVVNFNDGSLGYAQYPISSNLPGVPGDAATGRLTDGIVIQYTAFGSRDDGPFNVSSAYDKGRTATHEMGHFLGALRHIWGDVSDCSGTDYVADTPNQAGPTNRCPSGVLTSCGVSNMYQNYMDYTYDACMNLFTAGQVSRMVTVLANSPRRLSLLTSPGLIPPISLATDIKMISIDSPSPVFCTNQTTPVVTLKNQGSNAITSFKVTTLINTTTTTQQVSGVSILSGEQKQFVLAPTFFATGTNTLTITVSEPNGFTDATPSNNTLNLNLAVNNASDIIPYRQNFDGSYPDWTIISQGQSQKWVSTATNKNLSLAFNAFSNTSIGDQAWLVSPTLNLSKETKASIFFDVSYATRNSKQDNLTILASTDCGLTFPNAIYNKSGDEISGLSTSNSWTPQTVNDWTREFIDLSSLAGQKNVRLAFVATNDNGNNIFVDNVEFFADNNSDPVKADPPYSIYAGKDFTVTFNLPERQEVHAQIFNVMGQVVVDQHLYDILNQTYPADLSQQTSGLYIVRIQIGGQFYVNKVVVTH